MLPTLLLACAPASIQLDDTGKAGDPTQPSTEDSADPTGLDTATDTTTTTTTTTTTSTTTDSTTTTETDALEGEWTGDAVLSVPEWGWTVCTLPMTVAVAGGLLVGAGTCTADLGWGGAYDLPLSLSGEVDEDGAAAGAVSLEYTGWSGTTTFDGDFAGDVAEDSMSLTWTLMLDFGMSSAEGQGSFEGRR